jgi:hypothetical protein
MCPSWAANLDFQRFLIDDALEDSGESKDAFGRPKKLWNAVEGVVFIGISCNLQEPLYNCYPETPPPGKLFAVLQRRAERTRDEVLDRSGDQ